MIPGPALPCLTARVPRFPHSSLHRYEAPYLHADKHQKYGALLLAYLSMQFMHGSHISPPQRVPFLLGRTPGLLQYNKVIDMLPTKTACDLCCNGCTGGRSIIEKTELLCFCSCSGSSIMNSFNQVDFMYTILLGPDHCASIWWSSMNAHVPRQ